GALEDTLSSKLENRSFTRKFNRKFPDPTDELIFSCQKGVRAQKASEIATRLGYKKVKVYKGSWIDWAKHEGIPISLT
ncbi:unnamed protein product, partial [Hermetia illucens]